MNNYRPISILPALSKILEKLLNIRLTSFLERYHSLAANQFGFRPCRSTEDAVSSFINKVVDKLDNRQKCLGIFLDIRKAFDTVSVPHLLVRMESIGIRGYAPRIFKDYLSERNQCVKIDCHVSDSASCTFGIPQGSVLGPTLFLLYINSLCNLSIQSCYISAYADDALLIHGKTWAEVFVRSEHALNRVIRWLSNSLLSLNLSKTTYLTFSLSSRTQPSLDMYHLRAHVCSPEPRTPCDCPVLSRSTQVKYLGVYIDCLLSWKEHIACLTSRMRKMIYIFKKLRNSANLNILKTVYCALCQSILSYCITVWGGAAKSHILPLERAQRTVLKVLSFKPFRYSTAQLYSNCKLLSVRQLFVLETIIKKHSSLHYTPDSLHKRRTYKVCPNQHFNTSLAARHYNILSSHLYNLLNKCLNIYPLSRTRCKKIIIIWLQAKTYAQIENLLKIGIL